MYSSQARRSSRNSLVIADDSSSKPKLIDFERPRESKSLSPRQHSKQQHLKKTTGMAALTVAPYKSIQRVHTWDENVEENYRFQCAGFRDLRDFETIENYQEKIDRWPHNGFIKKLVRRDGCFMYFNRGRECIDKEVHKVKLYKY